MSDIYNRSQNLVAGGSSVTVGASATDSVVSQVLLPGLAGSRNFLCTVTLSACTDISGVSIALEQEVAPEVWQDVGNQSTVSVVSKTFADADVNSGTEAITTTAHGFVTGDAVQYDCDGAGIVTGLTDGTTYYVIRVDADTLKLATSAALASAGTAVNVTQPSGGDGHYLTSLAPLIIRMNIENSSDEPQLPLFPKVRVVATTGSGDSITVSGVYLARGAV